MKKTETAGRFTRLLSAALLLTLLVPLASCSSGVNEEPDDAAPTDEAAAPAVEEEEEAEIPPEVAIGIPEGTDYGGHTYNIFTYEHSAYRNEHIADEMTGEPVNDALYMRNLNTSELLNVKIAGILNPWDNDMTRTSIRASVMTADEAYDLFTGNTYNMTALSAEGMFYNVNKLDTIHLTNPWWNEVVAKELSVGEKLFLLYGDLSKSNYSQFECYFFNKDYIRDYNFEDPYELFRNDEWKMDKLISMTKDFYVDIDGNGVRDETDIYGEYSPTNSVLYITNNWITVTEKDENNYPQVVFYSERTQGIMDTMREYLSSSSGVWAPSGWTDYELFMNGNSVFMYNSLGQAINLRAMESDYGIMPIPKYDDTQTEYKNSYSGTVVAIPNCAPDPNRTGLVAESLSYFGRKLVYPAYVEDAIMIKGVRDPDAQLVIETILNSGHANFGASFSGFSGYGYALSMYLAREAGFASFYASIEKPATRELTDYADKILALED